MKYIDADKMIAEIEKWRDKAKEKYNESVYNMGRCDALAEFRNHIVALQQEQPAKRYCEEHCKGYKETGGKCFFEWNCSAIKQQEQPEVDFEKAYKSYMKSRKDDLSGNAVTVNMKDMAHYFWNKGYNARKED